MELRGDFSGGRWCQLAMLRGDPNPGVLGVDRTGHQSTSRQATGLSADRLHLPPPNLQWTSQGFGSPLRSGHKLVSVPSPGETPSVMTPRQPQKVARTPGTVGAYLPIYGSWTKRLRRGIGGSRRPGGGWPSLDSGVIPLDFRPSWLEFLGPDRGKGITMSKLRKRMIRDIQFVRLVEGTGREYLQAVRQLAAYYMALPDQLIARKVED